MSPPQHKEPTPPLTDREPGGRLEAPGMRRTLEDGSKAGRRSART